MDKVDERRLFSRLTFATDAKLISHDSPHQTCSTTKLLDISLNGALVLLPPDFHFTGTDLTLEFSLQEPEIKVVMQTKLVHSENQQLGLACQHIDVESISHLRRLLELNLGDASLLDRELERLFEHKSLKTG
ncbi:MULTISPECIES: PilZ domain-containing protein [unclassified Shewanella]|uniref:PilZ domain-containing protein n=1 Tax=unclassified Shewanella TaxID=196818 RepID=UPI001BC65180|nr:MULTISPECIES: PilZ domain-containing protein [unclassified Shewanella]GIU13223.1 cyclic diguanosine monophosphate-binding protein [Shewanella sp. MBTL60-112-B1]GIU27219.1 cyclic diguanosine monophosphate-binding protein [Shewanella sp. MBTL60-112-B2]